MRHLLITFFHDSAMTFIYTQIIPQHTSPSSLLSNPCKPIQICTLTISHPDNTTSTVPTSYTSHRISLRFLDRRDFPGHSWRAVTSTFSSILKSRKLNLLSGHLNVLLISLILSWLFDRLWIYSHLLNIYFPLSHFCDSRFSYPSTSRPCQNQKPIPNTQRNIPHHTLIAAICIHLHYTSVSTTIHLHQFFLSKWSILTKTGCCVCHPALRFLGSASRFSWSISHVRWVNFLLNNNLCVFLIFLGPKGVL